VSLLIGPKLSFFKRSAKIGFERFFPKWFLKR